MARRSSRLTRNGEHLIDRATLGVTHHGELARGMLADRVGTTTRLDERHGTSAWSCTVATGTTGVLVLVHLGTGR